LQGLDDGLAVTVAGQGTSGLMLLAVLVRGGWWARAASAMRWMAWVRMAGEVAKFT